MNRRQFSSGTGRSGHTCNYEADLVCISAQSNAQSEGRHVFEQRHTSHLLQTERSHQTMRALQCTRFCPNSTFTASPPRPFWSETGNGKKGRISRPEILVVMPKEHGELQTDVDSNVRSDTKTAILHNTGTHEVLVRRYEIFCYSMLGVCITGSQFAKFTSWRSSGSGIYIPNHICRTICQVQLQGQADKISDDFLAANCACFMLTAAVFQGWSQRAPLTRLLL